MGILTEEELKDISVRRLLKPLGVNWETVDKIISSHRIFFSANAELSFKNQKLKKALEVAKYYLERDAHLPAEQIIDEALEELK